MKQWSVLFLFLSIFAFSENEEVTEIFETYQESIVYINQTLYFESSSVKHPELFKKMEEYYEMDILDNYFTLASGSGFFITDEGHIITNHHVIDTSELDELRDNMLWMLWEKVSRDMYDKILTGKEIEKLMGDFEFLLKESDFHFRLIVNNELHYSFKILKSDEDVDIAIVKIEDRDKIFTAIPLGDSDKLKVGKDVIALGYPLQSTTLDYLFKDLKSTLTTGKISALRNET